MVSISVDTRQPFGLHRISMSIGDRPPLEPYRGWRCINVDVIENIDAYICSLAKRYVELLGQRIFLLLSLGGAPIGLRQREREAT